MFSFWKEDKIKFVKKLKQKKEDCGWMMGDIRLAMKNENGWRRGPAAVAFRFTSGTKAIRAAIILIARSRL